MVIFRLGWSNSEIISQTSVHRIVNSTEDCYYHGFEPSGNYTLGGRTQDFNKRSCQSHSRFIIQQIVGRLVLQVLQKSIKI
jgi:hypothetical protein